MPATLPPKTEFKTFPFEVKSIDEDQGIVTGYLSTFNNVDEQKDRVLPNAFRKTIAEAKNRMQNGRKYLYPALWMHNPDDPIGGVVDAAEDEHGLLVTMQLDITANAQGHPNNLQATKVFSGFKQGYIDELSMGYNAIQKEYEGGIRNLKECRLVESSAVTMLFAANPEALVPASGVKTMGIDTPTIEEKTVCGNTSGPIGERDESWSGSAAEKWIWSKALDEEGNVKPAIAKKYFMRLNGDPKLKGSYGYAFWNDDHINVGGVKAVANALSGARNADAGEDTAGMKKKVEKLYRRINAKYKDADPLVPPWSGKGGNMSVDRKDFNTLYMAAQAADALEDWSDLVDTLTQAMMQAFCIGDEPQSDMQDALNQFGEATMKWVDAAMACSMDDYLSDRFGYNNDTPYVPYSMRMGGYDRMSRGDKPEGKAGARFSADSKQTLQDHADALKQMATEHKTLSDQLAAQQKDMSKAMKAHSDMLEQKANDLTQIWKQEGQGDAFSEDNTGKDGGKSNSQAKDDKRREPSHPTLTRTPEAQPVTTTEDEEIKALEAALAGWTKK